MALDDYGNPEPGDLPDANPPAPTTSGGDAGKRHAIAAAYQKYLGRPPKEHEYASWIGNGNFEQEIAASPEAKQFSSTGTAGPQQSNVPQQWLDWIERTYGRSAKRGGGFADLPAGVSLQQALQRFNQETGHTAQYIGGPSGDKVDFGQGAKDVLTGEGQLWYNFENGGNGGGGTGGGGQSPTPHGPDDPIVPLPGGETPEGDWFSVNGPSGSGGGYTTLQRPSWLTGPYVPGTFTAPTADELYQDPGYKGRMDASRQAFERGAAAKGSLLSGGSQVALGRRMQTEAANEYQNLYGRKFGEFGAQEGLNFNARQTNENTFQNDVGNNLTQYNTRYKAYQDFLNNQFRLTDQGIRATEAGRP